MDPRWRVAILGATGVVGQQFVRLLAVHPWFEIRALVASSRSAGKPYGEAVRWLLPEPIPAEVASMPVLEPDALPEDVELVFSALDAISAEELEPKLARAGYPVISNASRFRLHPQVPLVVPEVNPEHLALIRHQGFGEGLIVTNPNCSTVGLVLALKPLEDRFGLESVVVTTLQAVSGAGYPGVPALDILGNVLPHIAGEEEKLETEPLKILGRLEGDRVQPAPVRISAQANRVPVLDGHLLSVSVRLRVDADPEAVRAAWLEYTSPIADLNLPSAPERPLRLFERPDWPQPRLHATADRGMSISLGRLRPCPVGHVRFVALVHNTVRGAAGAALLNAELLVRQGWLKRRLLVHGG
ncbi:MAG: aspartate-semialdehyde dehydrogenase [Bacteroidetes bacterium]|nr:aspartate-semialdehyde dehydrogenase [Rhodothermia bacterium]MCS7154345.1 aspartate-semialdehyde dehydrogenase [Bacteroidota bacterium]MCX7906618.1 aspartate-semialdehyde dehydrogenase [Bacteroidota bacterium]MDW8137101.1 aspartate-semialdehyde dehydrogenase [Bacteroidota bacterium]MDW8285028.1 aspartate-semialdehyde dehydrogenase [Bacteroidota bacterium]